MAQTGEPVNLLSGRTARRPRAKTAPGAAAFSRAGRRLRGVMSAMTHETTAAAGLNREFAGRLTTLGNGQSGLRDTLRVEASRPAAHDAGGDGGCEMDFVASDATLDRAGEVIVAEGWRLEEYRRNPVFQNAHNYGNILHTLGRALIAEVRGGRLFLRIRFAVEANPLARLAYELYRGGFLRAVSVGFRPLRWENGNERTPWRRRFLEQELLEVSAVAVPANPNALALALKAGVAQPDDLEMFFIPNLKPQPQQKHMDPKQTEELTLTLDRIKGGVNQLQTTARGHGEEIAGLRRDLDHLRRGQAQRAQRTGGEAPGRVSDDCARHLAALVIAGALKGGRLDLLAPGQRDALHGLCRETLGAETKAALTGADVPLPAVYSAEVVELVARHGAARRYGTVYPLGAGVVKLPRLKTDPAFGLIAMSAAVTEKSPQLEFVTLTASKWGGLVRIPAEIDEDSVVAVGQFVARYAARQLAKIEDIVFFAADGTATYDSLEGLTTSTVTNGKVTQMAATKTKYSDSTLANWRALRAVPDAAVLAGGAYYCHPSFEQHLAGFNAAGDKPYSAAGAQGAALDGFPVRWVDALPAYSTGANAGKVFALFGDLSYQYLGVRGGVNIAASLEAAFSTDEILVRALERFTIGLMAPGAVAGLQTAAS